MAETGPWWRDPWGWALALWGAAVAILAFPPSGLGVLALAGPAPLWAACLAGGDRPCWRRGLARGWLYGIGFFGGLLWWICPTMTRYGGLPLAAGVACLVLLASYLALYPALGAALVAAAGSRSPGLSLAAAPFLWTGLEGVRACLFTGFPWGDLPQALWRSEWALALAPWVGIDGVRLLLAAAAGALAWAGLRAARPVQRRSLPSWLGLLPLAAGAPVAAVLLALPAPSAPKAGELRVGVVQGNIEQAQKWDRAYRAATLRTYRELSRAAAAKGTGLILWPETAVPFQVQEPSDERAGLEALARELRTFLLFGAPAYAQTQNRLEYRNAVFLMDPSGALTGRYDKVHLVPFGEFMPFGRLFPFITKLVEGVGDFSSGPGIVPIRPSGGLPVLGPLICFAVIFPALSAKHLEAGAQMLAVVTNDGWFGSTPGPYQHLAFAAWRAAETGLPLIRAANTGISAVFDARGHLLHTTELQARDAFVLTVPYLARHLTPQARIRPWIWPGSLTLALAAYSAILLRPEPRKRP
jgi:apolipoprotein N-acyltransferase